MTLPESRGSWRPPRPARPRRQTWLVVVGAVAVLLAAAAIVLMSAGRTTPTAAAAAVAEETGRWAGVSYSGELTDVYQGTIGVQLTVTDRGAVGVFTRDSDLARAELVFEGSTVFLRADRAWWAPSYPTAADMLADTWIADVKWEVPVVHSYLRLAPARLVELVTPGEDAIWRHVEEADVAGQPVWALSDDDDYGVVSVTRQAPHTVVALELEPGAGALRVAPASAAQVAEVTAGLATVRQAPTVLLAEVLRTAPVERKSVEIHFSQDVSPCHDPMCSATAEVVNVGTRAVSGTLYIMVSGELVGSFRFTLEPGATETFHASVDNPGYAVSAADQSPSLSWDARVDLDR